MHFGLIITDPRRAVCIASTYISWTNSCNNYWHCLLTDVDHLFFLLIIILFVYGLVSETKYKSLSLSTNSQTMNDNEVANIQ